LDQVKQLKTKIPFIVFPYRCTMALQDVAYNQLRMCQKGVLGLIKAVVFDFDGLILDTETPEFESFKAMYRDHGAELTIEQWGQCIGTDSSLFEPYQHLEQCLGSVYDRDGARLRRRQYYTELMCEAKPRAGVLNYLQTAGELGLKIGLASSSRYEWVSVYLKQYGLFDYFQCIRTREDVEKVKPDPALYIQVMAALGVRPHEAIAFEDSPNGSLAATKAGMHCVIVPNDITSLLTFGKHDLRLQSMTDLPLKELINRILYPEIHNRA
jgi:HAD superfamily hydrolase (TIGR01509 family)